MAGFSLLNDVKIDVMLRGDTALAATNQDSTVVLDMSGYEGCMFVASVVETTAGGTTGTVQLLPRHSTSNASTALTDFGSTAISGTTALSTGNIKDWTAVDVYKPTKRYLGISLDKTGANTSLVGPVLAIRYNVRKAAVSQTTGEYIQSKTVVSHTTA